MDQGQLCHYSRSFPRGHSYMKALRAVKAQKMPDSVLFHLISSVIQDRTIADYYTLCCCSLLGTLAASILQCDSLVP